MRQTIGSNNKKRQIKQNNRRTTNSLWWSKWVERKKLRRCCQATSVWSPSSHMLSVMESRVYLSDIIIEKWSQGGWKKRYLSRAQKRVILCMQYDFVFALTFGLAWSISITIIRCECNAFPSHFYLCGRNIAHNWIVNHANDFILWLIVLFCVGLCQLGELLRRAFWN